LGSDEKRSQMDSPLPSSFHAPSIWYAAVAVPHTKFSGNRSMSLMMSFPYCTQPLTAPAVTPPIIHLLAKKNSTNGGRATSMIQANWIAYCEEYCPWKLIIAKGKVFRFPLARKVLAIMYSFQLLRAVMTTTVSVAGAAIGAMI